MNILPCFALLMMFCGYSFLDIQVLYRRRSHVFEHTPHMVVFCVK